MDQVDGRANSMMNKKDLILLVNRFCDEFETELKTGGETRVDLALKEAADTNDNAEFLDLLSTELISLQISYSDNPDEAADNLLSRFPEKSDVILRAKSNSGATKFGGSGVEPLREDVNSKQDLPGSDWLDDWRRDIPTGNVPRRFGNYELSRLLGEGGMGRVYLARQIGAEREVALKIIRPELAADRSAKSKEMISRFRSESKTAAAIDHPAIATVYEVGEIYRQPFYSMKYIEGQTLSQYIRSLDSPMPSRELAKIAMQVAAAIESAHKVGVLHRDIKPGNIMLDRDLDPYVVDFGLAFQLKMSKIENSFKTRTGALLGTVAYMSPEQAKDPSLVQATSDVYGLGGVIYFMLTGETPLHGNSTLESLRKLHDEEIRKPSSIRKGVPPELETICLKCLSKEPAERYATAGQLAEDLGRFLNNEPIVARPPSLLVRARKWVGRNRLIACMLGVMALGLAAGLFTLNNANAHLGVQRVKNLAETTISVEMDALPSLIKKLCSEQDFGPELLPEPNNDAERFRVTLAALPLQPEKESVLCELAGELTAEQTKALVKVVVDHEMQPNFLHWQDLGADDSNRLLPTACLAASGEIERDFFDQHQSQIAGQLVALSEEERSHWLAILSPVRERISNAGWRFLVPETEPRLRSGAVNLISEYSSDQLHQLVSLLAVAAPDDLRFLWPKLEKHLDVFEDALDGFQADPDSRGLSVPLEKHRMTKNFLLARMRFTDADKPWKALAAYKNPDLSIGLIHECALAQIPVDLLVEKLKSSNPDLVYAVLMTLPEYGRHEFGDLEKTTQSVGELYREHPDGGVHCAAKLLLEKWDERELLDLDESHPEPTKDWYEIAGFTMVKAETADGMVFSWPLGVQMAGKTKYSETHVDLCFAISAYEVTREQFALLIDEPNHRHSLGPTMQDPANMVSYLQATDYCNRLTIHEGLGESECCYETKENGFVVLVEDYQQKKGFRLPTECEWEWACSSGSMLKHCFGTDLSYKAKYIWHQNSTSAMTKPVGLLKPNRFGLFDVFGNISELAHRDFVLPMSKELEESRQFEVTKGKGAIDLLEKMELKQHMLVATDGTGKYAGFRIVQSISND